MDAEKGIDGRVRPMVQGGNGDGERGESWAMGDVKGRSADEIRSERNNLFCG